MQGNTKSSDAASLHKTDIILHLILKYRKTHHLRPKSFKAGIVQAIL
jgi:hypothetical protein